MVLTPMVLVAGDTDALGPALSAAGMAWRPCRVDSLEGRSPDWSLLAVVPPVADGEAGIRLLASSHTADASAWRLLATADTGATHLMRAVNRGRVDAILPWPCPMANLVEQIQRGVHETIQRRINAAECGDPRLREAEERAERFRQQVLELERRSLLPHLLRGLTHELNNPLGVILGHAERMERSADADSDGKRRAGILLAETRRCIALVDRLRGLAQSSTESQVLTELPAAFRLAQDLLRERHLPALTVRFRQRPPPVQAAPRALARALEQILDNARLAGAGEVLVEAGVALGRVQLHIDNEGETPSDEVLRSAVQPFFSTRAADGHQGLGLTLALGLLRDMGGSLILTHRPQGSGCRCTLTLPAPSERATDTFTRQGSDGPPSPIVLIDDEPLITELVGDLLSGSRHPLVACASLAEAESLLRSGPVAAVLCDCQLPDGDGTAFLREKIAAIPALQGHVALITGDPHAPQVRQAAAELSCPVIAKPFRMSDIQRVLADILSGRR